MNSMLSIKRCILLVVVGVIATLGVLLVGPSSASASAPYPPTAPTSAPPSYGVSSAPVVHRREASPADDGAAAPSSTDGTASTGFDALTASLIAAGLLGGGVLLVFAPRRSRRRTRP